MQELYHSMTDDPTSGYRVLGYFEDFPSDRYPMNIAYLGQPCEAVDYLTRNAGKVDQLYCSLPSARSTEIVPIINYCEHTGQQARRCGITHRMIPRRSRNSKALLLNLFLLIFLFNQFTAFTQTKRHNRTDIIKIFGERIY